nr:subtilisin-like protease SBT4.14 isoform X2 [Ipomoea batatas]
MRSYFVFENVGGKDTYCLPTFYLIWSSAYHTGPQMQKQDSIRASYIVFLKDFIIQLMKNCFQNIIDLWSSLKGRGVARGASACSPGGCLQGGVGLVGVQIKTFLAGFEVGIVMAWLISISWRSEQGQIYIDAIAVGSFHANEKGNPHCGFCWE